MTVLDLSPGEPPLSALFDFEGHLARSGCAPLRRAPVHTLQVNVTKRCNLACHHCHVESGPTRSESMDARTAERVLALLEANPSVRVLDLTGGAPELNAHFRDLVRGARALGRRVIDRCNLVVFFEPGQADTPEFLAANDVEVVASLPCYTRENVEQQRGKDVFAASIRALTHLNELGYARPGTGLKLDLVYNPLGASLPPPADELEATYRRELAELFGLRFDALLTLTNMPIKRFARTLERTGQLESYLGLLVNHFNPSTPERVMCRNTLSVGYDGRLWDCDFNQMLEIDPPHDRRTVWEVADLSVLVGASIATASHCFGCTAGAGSSCGGSLA